MYLSEIDRLENPHECLLINIDMRYAVMKGCDAIEPEWCGGVHNNGAYGCKFFLEWEFALRHANLCRLAIHAAG